MKAIVIKKFEGVPDGEVYAKTHNPGKQIDGNLARAMVQAGLARWRDDEGDQSVKKTKPKKPREGKSLGGAPMNKSG